MNPTFIPSAADTVASFLDRYRHLPPITFGGWEAIAGAVVTTMVLMLWQALLVERALAMVTGTHVYQARIEARWPSADTALAYLCSLVACTVNWFDAMAMVMGRPYTMFGVAVTAASVCGGSQWVIALADRFIQGAKHIREEAKGDD